MDCEGMRCLALQQLMWNRFEVRLPPGQDPPEGKANGRVRRLLSFARTCLHKVSKGHERDERAPLRNRTMLWVLIRM